LIIRETHLTNIHGGGAAMSTLDKVHKRDQFSRLCQHSGMSIAMFKKNFENLVSEMDGLGMDQPPDDQLALIYLGKLDRSRYDKMNVQLRNDALRGIAFPGTLKQAYDFASNWKKLDNVKTSTSGDIDSSYAFVLCDDIIPVSPDRGRKYTKRPVSKAPVSKARSA
jgi:hypothetical protein